MSVTLYGLDRSVYTRIARLVLEEKGVAYELREVEIFGPDGVPPEHRARHPFGRIPVLEHDDFLLYETASITRYVDEAFPGPALQPQDVHARARMNQVIGIVDSYGYRPMVWDVFVERVSKARHGQPPDEARTASGLGAAERCLHAIDALVRPQPYLLSSSVSLADVHLLPVLACLAIAPEGRELLSRHAGILDWFHAMNRRPSVERTRFPLERTLPPA